MKIDAFTSSALIRIWYLIFHLFNTYYARWRTSFYLHTLRLFPNYDRWYRVHKFRVTESYVLYIFILLDKMYQKQASLFENLIKIHYSIFTSTLFQVLSEYILSQRRRYTSCKGCLKRWNHIRVIVLSCVSCLWTDFLLYRMSMHYTQWHNEASSVYIMSYILYLCL